MAMAPGRPKCEQKTHVVTAGSLHFLFNFKFSLLRPCGFQLRLVQSFAITSCAVLFWLVARDEPQWSLGPGHAPPGFSPVVVVVVLGSSATQSAMALTSANFARGLHVGIAQNESEPTSFSPRWRAINKWHPVSDYAKTRTSFECDALSQSPLNPSWSGESFFDPLSPRDIHYRANETVVEMLCPGNGVPALTTSATVQAVCPLPGPQRNAK